MRFFKDWELEIKLILVTLVFFTIFGFYIFRVYSSEFDAIVSKGMDRELMLYFQKKAAENHKDPEIIKFLERRMQLEVSAPFIVRMQKNYIKIVLFFYIFLLLLIITLTLVRLTSPLKKLAKSVERIGKGEYVKIETKSSGLIGELELQIAKMQDELKTLHEKEQIAAAEKAWRDIARVMAHEIKNPLTPMRLLIDRIEEKNAVSDEITSDDLKKFTERMNRQLNALEILVNKFRSFSKSQEAVCSEQNLYSAVKESADDFQNEITTVIEGEQNAAAFFDRNFLEQILLNIYKNSINAGAKNMRATIRDSGAFMEIYLADDGKGIAKEYLDKIFLPYITFSKGGSGIGLSVVKNLCENMGGECFVKSEPGKGFTVILKLKK